MKWEWLREGNGKRIAADVETTWEVDSCQSPKLDQDFLADHNCDHSADSKVCKVSHQTRREGFADGRSSDSASRDSASGCNSCMDPHMILPMTTACVYVGFWVRFASSGCMTWIYKQMGPEEVCEVRQQTGGVSAAVPSISQPGQVKSRQIITRVQAGQQTQSSRNLWTGRAMDPVWT